MAESSEEIAFREQQMSDNLMSPFCPGRTLLACPSEEATKLRGEIREMLESGKVQREIEQTLVQRYGEDIRGLGGLGGLGSALGVAPIVFLAAAFLLVVLFLKRSKSEHSGSEGIGSFSPDRVVPTE